MGELRRHIVMVYGALVLKLRNDLTMVMVENLDLGIVVTLKEMKGYK